MSGPVINDDRDEIHPDDVKEQEEDANVVAIFVFLLKLLSKHERDDQLIVIVIASFSEFLLEEGDDHQGNQEHLYFVPGVFF